MMKKILFILFSILIYFPAETYCQKSKSISQVRAEAAKAKKAIEKTNKLLKETEKSKSISVERLTLLNQQIKERNGYIMSLQQEIDFIESDIFYTNAKIHTLSSELEELQKDYNLTLFTLYKINSQYEQLIFILSADNFNQAYNRLKYLQYYSDYMIQQAKRIKSLQDSLSMRENDLETLLLQKKDLIGSKQSEAKKLAQDKYQEDITIQKLNARQQQLKRQLARKQEQAAALNKQIEALIKAEMARKAKAAKKASSTSSNKSTESENTLTPEEKIISKNFSENKGRLPWPTTTGKITEHYGRHKHPTLEYVEVESSGVEITTTKGAKARAIFDGTVAKIVLIPGRNTAVLIKHGNYYTVYDNLVQVVVKTGQQIKVKDEIGTIYTDPETNSTVLQLQIWKELNKMDPEQWLSK